MFARCAAPWTGVGRLGEPSARVAPAREAGAREWSWAKGVGHLRELGLQLEQYCGVADLLLAREEGVVLVLTQHHTSTSGE
jgi:hypothetical protein